MLSYYGSTKAERRADVHQLHSIPHRIELIVFILTVTYFVAVIPYNRWLRTLLGLIVIVNTSLRLAQFNFRSKVADPVPLASFYVACIAVTVSIMVSLI